MLLTHNSFDIHEITNKDIKKALLYGSSECRKKFH